LFAVHGNGAPAPPFCAVRVMNSVPVGPKIATRPAEKWISNTLPGDNVMRSVRLPLVVTGYTARRPGRFCTAPEFRMRPLPICRSPALRAGCSSARLSAGSTSP
jgi:hypothetical protein